MIRNSHAGFIALMLSLAFLGCGSDGPEIASVEGTITMDGEPLANASVLFVPTGGRPAAARTDENGKYTLNFTAGRKGAMLGKNVVRISTAADPSETPDGEPIPAQPERVPMKYNATSELTFVVEAGKKNVADFDITSEGPIAGADEALDN